MDQPVLGGLLGEGAFGSVFNYKEGVCIKVLYGDIGSPSHKCFMKEVNAMSKLRGNPNVVTFFGYSYDFLNKKGWINMERLPLSLSDVFQNLSWSKIPSIIKGIVNGITFIHQQGMIHTDLKLDNVMITADDTPKIIDFSHAISATKQTSHNCYGSLTIRPIDVYHGNTQIGPEFDSWAVGCMAIELITGKWIDQALSMVYDYGKEEQVYQNAWKEHYKTAEKRPDNVALLMISLIESTIGQPLRYGVSAFDHDIPLYLAKQRIFYKTFKHRLEEACIAPPLPSDKQGNIYQRLVLPLAPRFQEHIEKDELTFITTLLDQCLCTDPIFRVKLD